MKNYIILAAFILLTACNDKSSNQFIINGSTEGINDQQVKLTLLSGEGMQVQKFDAVEIVNGKFKIEGELVQPPTLVSLVFEQEGVKLWKRFLIDNSTMDLKIWKVEEPNDIPPTYDAILNGSKSNDELEKMTTTLRELNKEVSMFAATFRKLGNNGQLPMDQWSKEDLAQVAKMEEIDKEATLKRNKFLSESAQGKNEVLKLLAIPELYHWGIAPFNSFELCEEAFDELHGDLKTSHLRAYYSSEIHRKSEQMRLAREVTVDNKYKNFTQNNPEGKPITASDIVESNQYVLLDFWASWCGPCRKENPNLLKTYNEFHDKGFDVLAISIDEKEKAWKKAIEQDGMPWTQVSDLKGPANDVATLYSVTGVPSSFLIDSQSGRIIATDLRGEDLDNKLKELFAQ
ncbi:TlpA disulfide reductase family protein [Roseivirga misakiensis]|uniref:Thioredoxin domain-containing protein n=1 Tax=Roseivirga misakiensis TaxID=1563681 RepID=A0A1E5T524_9BACT|nr:TlpA disulfide reductase family protein [Roseivirga misakiensis]OEK06474.1 hypothetical protein BFP71_02005 [Roseivirga misakiensis]